MHKKQRDENNFHQSVKSVFTAFMYWYRIKKIRKVRSCTRYSSVPIGG